MLVTGGGFADNSTSCTGLSTGLGHAIAAEPHAVSGLDQRDDSSAMGTWRPDDVRGPGVTEPLDQKFLLLIEQRVIYGGTAQINSGYDSHSLIGPSIYQAIKPER